ncbi:MAG: DUF5329 domain-containing protein [Nitrospiraceae bacterium]|nr:MAG: DUF5329 domain-containing protein [Nitrospiraceae bacterium]
MRRRDRGFITVQICAVVMLIALTSSLTHGNEIGVHQEITSLLQYIESSECIFIRNGREGTAAAARIHIQKKYDYFKDRVKSAEDFIRFAATKSTMSGRPYKVRCSGEETNTADWLTAELQKRRNRLQGERRRGAIDYE